MLLTSTSDIIRVTTSTTAPLDVQASWADITTTAFAPGRTNTKISSAATTTIVASPGASTQRQLKSLVIQNIDSSNSNVITVEHFDGTNAVEVYSRTLLAGESVEYDGTKWMPYNAAGIPISIAQSTPTDIQIFTTPGANTWTKPTSFTPKFVRVILYGAGGGGGAGASLATAVVAKGGAGGGGGACTIKDFLASDLASTVTVTVGAGGNAGTPGAAGAAGGAGGIGGNTSFGSLALGGGGGGGGGTTVTASTAGGAGGAGGTHGGGGGGGGCGMNPGLGGAGGAGGAGAAYILTW